MKKITKKLLMMVVAIGGLLSTNGMAQCTVNIPDAIFKNYLLGNSAINTNSDSQIQCSEATAYTGAIIVSWTGITDLTGIEAFTSLTELACNGNLITSLNIAGSTALTYLDCSSIQLSSLDVSSNLALTYLNCGGNPLTTIDVSANTALTNLYCGGIQLTSLDVSANTALNILSCDENQLTNLNLSANPALTVLTCSTNQLRGLNVSANPALITLDCHLNPLTSLDLSANPALTGIFCSYTQLLSLNIQNGNNINLQYLYKDNNPDLTCVQVDDEAFMYANWANSNNTGSNYSTNCPGCIVTIPDANFKNILLANSAINTNSDGEIQCTEAASYWGTINVSGAGITDLTGIQAFVHLGQLLCNNNQLTDLDVSAITTLTSLDCHLNQLSSLILSANTALTSVVCYSNQLNNLDLSGIAGLHSLVCDDNQLSAIEVTSNIQLNELGCSNNLLTNLNLLANTALTRIYCEGNQLTSLNLLTNTGLAYLSCNNNQLTNLDVTTNTVLEYLYCHSNQLTSLNIQNGTNSDLLDFDATLNPDLTCIRVDDAAYMNANWPAAKDAGTSYSIDCSQCNVTIPNTTFKNYLLGTGINSNGDGEIQCSEALAYTGGIVVESMGITDLTGIEAFVNITYLSCYDNQLTSLNVSANTALTGLSCSINQLTSLDISANTALLELGCDNNQLTSLDVSANTALLSLNCNNNQLTSLDISSNALLNAVLCANNQLTSLNVLSNTELYDITCGGNQIASLNLSANHWLSYLSCNNNQLTNLDVSANTVLQYLHCENNQLTTLDLAANTDLMNFDCHSNQLTSLDVSGFELTELICNDNQLATLNMQNGNNLNLLTFNATNNTGLTCIQVDDVAYMNANWASAKDAGAGYSTNCSVCNVTIPNITFKNYLLANGAINSNSDTEIQCTEAAAYTGSIVVAGMGITDLTGIESFTNLTALNCNSNLLTSLNVSANTALTVLICNNNQLTSLDMSANTVLFELVCSENFLTSLNVSGCTALSEFNCGHNNLTGLDVSANTALRYLDCYYNQLTSLDLSANTALEVLGCDNNQLTSLDLSANTLLLGLDCRNNQIASLNISSNTILSAVLCSNNQLTSLNVLSNININNITCGDNQLTSLDLSANTLLTDLSCNNNQLTTLDISANTLLLYLNCDNNQLTALDVLVNTNLIYIYCQSNQITSLDVSGHELTELICNDNQLTSLNMQNGNNFNLTTLDATGNPGLTCIQVDDVAYMNSTWAGGKDAGASYSIDCAGGCTSAPEAPAVSGPNAVCQMLTAIYTASSEGATSYTWGTLPTGMTYFTGNNNHSNPLKVNIAAGTLTGNLTATATNACGTSGVTTFVVTKKPGLPGAITATSLCGNATATFSVAPVFSATSYNWTVPAGLTIVGAAHGTSITVTKAATFIVGNVSVSAVNACGNVPGPVKTVYGQVPVTPAPITGLSSICASSSGNYSTAGSTGAMTYTWSTTGSNISVVGSGLNATVTFGNGFTTGTLSVKANNTCGNSSLKTITIKVKPCTNFMSPIIVDADEEKPTFNLYPNPTTGLFSVVSYQLSDNTQQTTNNNLTIEVYDVLGNKVMQSLIQNSQSEISLESFRNGMYFVRVVDGNSNTIYTQRVIKE